MLKLLAMRQVEQQIASGGREQQKAVGSKQ